MKQTSIAFKLVKDEDFITSLFILIDDLLKQFPLKISNTRSGRKPILQESELVFLAVIFSILGSDAFKDFYTLVKAFDCSYFKKINEHSRLLRNIKDIAPKASLIIHILLEINKKMDSKNNKKFIDSTPIPVCKNKRIFNYKVTDYASRGMSSMGWFYGFKLHIVINDKGKILSLKVTPGNVSDKNHKVVLNLLKGIRGTVVADAGYQSNPLKETLKQRDINFFTAVTKPMKKLMTKTQHNLLKSRQLVETIIGKIKYRKNPVTSLARSLKGYQYRIIFSLLAVVMLELPGF